MSIAAIVGSNLSSGAWWKAALIRALKTAVQIALPYAGVTALSDLPVLSIGSAAAMAFILSLLSSLFGLSEVDGVQRPWYDAIFVRVVKTVAQAIIAGVGTAALLQDVNWPAVLGSALTAGLFSVLTSIYGGQPEASRPVAATTVADTSVSDSGETVATATPVVAVTTPDAVAGAPAKDDSTVVVPSDSETAD